MDSDVHAESWDSQKVVLKTADKIRKELNPKSGQQQDELPAAAGDAATGNKE